MATRRVMLVPITSWSIDPVIRVLAFKFFWQDFIEYSEAKALDTDI